MNHTNRYFLALVLAAAAISASAGLGIADTQSTGSQAVVASAAEGTFEFVYFPSQYRLDAPGYVNEHIQAF